MMTSIQPKNRPRPAPFRLEPALQDIAMAQEQAGRTGL